MPDALEPLADDRMAKSAINAAGSGAVLEPVEGGDGPHKRKLGDTHDPHPMCLGYYIT